MFPPAQGVLKRGTPTIFTESQRYSKGASPKNLKITDVIPYKEKDFSTSHGSYN